MIIRIQCVLLEKPVENFLEICVDNEIDYALGQFYYLGDNGLFVYEDIDGYKYVETIAGWGLYLASRNHKLWMLQKYDKILWWLHNYFSVMEMKIMRIDDITNEKI